jgi:hypothetical protein
VSLPACRTREWREIPHAAFPAAAAAAAAGTSSLMATGLRAPARRSRGRGRKENIPVTRGRGHSHPPTPQTGAACLPAAVRPGVIGHDPSVWMNRRVPRSRPWRASFSACGLARRRRRGEQTGRGTGACTCQVQKKARRKTGTEGTNAMVL